MFLPQPFPVNYSDHYTRLIERARTRVLVGYSERHHVTPRCLGGDNDPSNIVRLTAEEHFVAHKLLVAMYPGNVRLLWAAVSMTNGSKKQQRSGNKLYGWLRRDFSEAMRRTNKGRVPSAETRAKMRVARAKSIRPRHSAEAKANIAAAARGRSKSPAHCEAISRAKTGKKHGPRSAEWIANQTAGIRAAVIDRSFTQDSQYKADRSAQMRDLWEKRRNGQAPMPRHATA